MNPGTAARLCDPALLAVREGHMARLSALFEGQRGPVGLWGLLGTSGADPYREPDRWLDECLDDLARQADRAADAEVFRPLVIEYGIYGVRFVDALFGARVYLADGNWWGDGVAGPVGALERPDLDRCEAWALARQVAEAFVAWGVTVPLFGLPTLSSALNIALNLYGEAFLTAMLTEPEAARHDLAVINDLIADLHRWYLERLPLEQLQPVIAFQRTQPPGFGQLCGCTCHLLSGQQYRDLVAPFDSALLETYPNGGMIHLCGSHTQHIETWRGMPSLRAVQLNDRAAEDLPAYFEGLRNDQVIYLNPTETMHPARALEITGGGRLVIVEDPAQRVGP